MTSDITQLIKRLKTLATTTDDPAIHEAISALETICGFYANRSQGPISVDNITNSTGIGIGHHVKMIINQLNLPAETAAMLLDIRNTLGSARGLNRTRYSLDAILTDKVRDFVGRAYVFDSIDEFMNNHHSGYFVIVGDPGMGKSSILAKYVLRKGCIAHFNVRASGITSARQFLENICTQIIVDFGLPYPNLPPEATQDGVFLLRLLQEVSEKIEDGGRLVVAVDALDEVDMTSHQQGANILYLPPVLPDKVYFILTRRDVDVPMVFQAPQREFDLKKTYSAESREDIKFYIRRKSEHPNLQAWITRQNMTEQDFVSKLADLSENNFMYLRYVLPEIESGSYQNLDIQRLPTGLKAYYGDHWLRMGMQVKPLPRVKICIVYVLCEVRQPVSRTLISEFATNEEMRVDELIVQEVLDEWSQFLHEQFSPDGALYSIYHSSFRDFLYRKDIVQAAEVTIKDINALIADNLWTQLFGKEDRLPA
jgi:hypothetical protein